MTSLLDTPIVSIFDMMVERHQRLRRELKEAVKGSNTLSRRLKEEQKPIIKSKPIPMKMTDTPEFDLPSPCPPNAITAAHLTKKQTSLKVQPPTNKEVIKKLVEKISKGRGPVATPSDRKSGRKTTAKSSKVVISPHRRRRMAGGQGSFRSKQKPSKPNITQIKRSPLSPRKMELGHKDEPPKTKVTKVKTTKILAEKSSVQMRSSKISEISGNGEAPLRKRWRL
ncbi:uncharacterized protein [Drosophila takahashii]|uniref:uncharacterized protein n=1 Tax=Drosophila takahashii TaxID=29030 RepID=UPI001CF820A6|nr:uncharacterized protein LOC108068814 [Drosophila takahashii]